MKKPGLILLWAVAITTVLWYGNLVIGELLVNMRTGIRNEAIAKAKVQDETPEQIKAREQLERGLARAKEARRAKKAAENQAFDKRVAKQVNLCPPEHCAAIGVFLISHRAEFGVLKGLGNIKLIGTLASGKVAYNVSLTNGRVIQFWLDGNQIFIVGEEINGGFIVHYGR